MIQRNNSATPKGIDDTYRSSVRFFREQSRNKNICVYDCKIYFIIAITHFLLHGFPRLFHPASFQEYPEHACAKLQRHLVQVSLNLDLFAKRILNQQLFPEHIRVQRQSMNQFLHKRVLLMATCSGNIRLSMEIKLAILIEPAHPHKISL